MPDYLTLASGCRTQNEFNRLHIDLENVLAPLEIANIARLENLPQASVNWLEKLTDLWPEIVREPRQFERRPLSDNIMAYGSGDVEPVEKDLLVAFCGNAGRLMMPVSIFLQFFDPLRWDLVVVRKKIGGSYQKGLDGVASDFSGLVQYLKGAVDMKQYRRVMTVGTSGGAGPAIIAAILMHASRGISICGSLPKSGSDGLPHGGDDLRFVYGEECARDHRAAAVMLEFFGGRLWPVAGASKHNVLKFMLSRRELERFFGEILG